MKELRVVAFAACTAAYGFALPVSAATYTIESGDVDDFTNKLEICNWARSGTIILKPGRYDVSKCSAVYWDTNKAEKHPDTHIAHDYITIRGETDNPRDVVVYGDGTKSIWYAYQGSIRNLTVSNGYIRSSSSCDGGAGITTYTLNINVSNVIVTCCTSEKGAGGTYLGTYRDCQILNNRAINNTSGGGASGNSTTSGRFYNCLFAGNTSDKNGGAANNCAFYGCVISNNTAKSSGGALYRGGNNYPQCLEELSNTVFIANKALTSAGGAFYDDSVVVCRNCQFIGNTATNGTGGAIYAPSTNQFFDCVISNNSCKANGGGAIGGGLYADCVIAFNQAGNDYSSGNLYGGGLQGLGSGKTKAVRSRFFGNACWYPKASASGNGGYSGGVGACELIDCSVYDNVAQSGGGASRDVVSASGTVFSNNVTLAGNPTIYLPKGAFSNCRFYGETIQPSARAFTGCRFLNHTKQKTIAEGANVVTNGTFTSDSYLFQGGMALTNCLIAGNAVNYVFRNNKTTTPVSIVNCTIASNAVSAIFDEFKVDDPKYPVPAEVVNTIIAQNVNSKGDVVDLSYSGGRNVAFTNCLIGPVRNDYAAPAFPEVNTVTNANPRFVMDGTADQYALKHSSPARGKGLVQDWMVGANDIRGEGYGRLRDEKGTGVQTVDIGCYQCWLDPLGLMLLLR